MLGNCLHIIIGSAALTKERVATNLDHVLQRTQSLFVLRQLKNGQQNITTKLRAFGKLMFPKVSFTALSFKIPVT
jgi:hypothetical protein